MDRKSPGPFTITRNVLLGLLAACCMMFVIGAIAPLSHPRIPMNHTRTAHSVVQLIAAERQYAARFPAEGFNATCGNLQKRELWIKRWRQVKRLAITTNCMAAMQPR